MKNELQNILLPNCWATQMYYNKYTIDEYLHIFFFSNDILKLRNPKFKFAYCPFRIKESHVPCYFTISKGWFGRQKITYSLWLNLILSKEEKKVLKDFVVNDFRSRWLSNPN